MKKIIYKKKTRGEKGSSRKNEKKIKGKTSVKKKV